MQPVDDSGTGQCRHVLISGLDEAVRGCGCHADSSAAAGVNPVRIALDIDVLIVKLNIAEIQFKLRRDRPECRAGKLPERNPWVREDAGERGLTVFSPGFHHAGLGVRGNAAIQMPDTGHAGNLGITVRDIAETDIAEVGGEIPDRRSFGRAKKSEAEVFELSRGGHLAHERRRVTLGCKPFESSGRFLQAKRVARRIDGVMRMVIGE